MRIKNWKNFQHFKDRRPPWIKLHREILDDFELNSLPPEAFRFIIQLWLIASEDQTLQGVLPSVQEISYRLRLSIGKCSSLLKQVDKFLISDCHQDDINAITFDASRVRDRGRDRTPLPPEGVIEEIFEFWKKERKRPDDKLDKTRTKRIGGCLQENYTVERIKNAILGISLSPYHMGDNDKKFVYDDIELICRSGKQVDIFADLWATHEKKLQAKRQAEEDFLKRTNAIDQISIDPAQHERNRIEAKRAREELEAKWATQPETKMSEIN